MCQHIISTMYQLKIYLCLWVPNKNSLALSIILVCPFKTGSEAIGHDLDVSLRCIIVVEAAFSYQGLCRQ